MATFAYRALDKTGKEIAGRTAAGNEGLVVERLRGMGYFPTEVKRVSTEKAGDVRLKELPGIRQLYRLITGGRVGLGVMTSFTREMATLLGAGISLLHSLEILRRNAESADLKAALDTVYQEVEGGASLSDAFSRHPRVFNKLYVNMVKAGEIGGTLEDILDRLATYFEKTSALRAKVFSALYYPVAVVIIATLLVSLILIFIVPRLQEVYEGMGAEFPALTQLLMDLSQLMRERAGWLIAGLILLGLLIREIHKTAPGKYCLDHLLLKTPVFGILIQKAAVARFCRTFGTLLQAGVPVLQSLVIVRDTSGNEILARATQDIHQAVREGGTLAEPMRKYPIFPDLAVNMLAVGEETGEMDKMLAKVADAYEMQVDRTVDGLTSLIEPILIVFLGVVIGFIVIALYMPILKPPVF